MGGLSGRLCGGERDGLIVGGHDEGKVQVRRGMVRNLGSVRGDFLAV